jgi:hypothetical protein
MKQVIRQNSVALAIGILLFMAGEFAGRYAGIVETAGVLIAVAGAVGIVLGLIIREPEPESDLHRKT